MFLDPEEVIKRIILVVGGLAIAGALGAAVWYNQNLKSIFMEDVEATSNLRQEANRIGIQTAEVKGTVAAVSRELRTAIGQTSEDTRRVDGVVRQQTVDHKSLLADHRKLAGDTEAELGKLRDTNLWLLAQLREREAAILEALKARDAAQAKINSELREQLKARSAEVADLQSRLEREIDWRNKNWWSR